MSIESVMLSNHLILCHPLLLLSSIFASIRVFSNESAFCIRWPKYWSFSFNISPSNDYSGLTSFRIERKWKGNVWVGTHKFAFLSTSQVMLMPVRWSHFRNHCSSIRFIAPNHNPLLMCLGFLETVNSWTPELGLSCLSLYFQGLAHCLSLNKLGLNKQLERNVWFSRSTKRERDYLWESLGGGVHWPLLPEISKHDSYNEVSEPKSNVIRTQTTPFRICT